MRRAFLLECIAFGSRLPRVPVGMSCVRFMPAMRFYWNVLRSITPVSFPLSGKERRLAVSCVSIPRGSGSPLERSRRLCGYRTCLVHFWIVRFFVAIPTEYEGTRRRGERSRRRGKMRFCVNLLALPCFPRGERWGCAPQTAPKSLRLSGLSSWGSRPSTSYQTSH